VTNICGTPGATTPCTSAVAFVPPSRTRFFLQEWGGLRWKTYYVKSRNTSGEFGGLCDTREAGQVCPIFPGTFDVTVGQNSAYSSGQVRGILVRTEAFYPLPFYPMLHVFFTGWIHASGKNVNLQPLLLDTAPSSVTVTSPGVQTVVLPVSNRDFYRLGMGLDLVQLVGKLTKQNAGSQTPATPASGTGTGGSKPAPAGASPTGSSGTGTQSTGGSKGSGASPADTTISIAAGKASQTGI